MQIVKIENRTRAEFYACDFIRGRARAGVVPRPDDEKMFRARFWWSVREMIPVVRERTQFVAVVLTCDCQDGQCDFLKLLPRRHHCVVVRVDHWVFKDTLEINGRISNE